MSKKSLSWSVNNSFIIALLMVFFFSCSKKVYKPFYSELTYEPIPEVKLSPYKSPQERQMQDETLALGIALSGGGTRAQYFTLGVLMGLDEIKNPEIEDHTVLDELDYFSAVSGGSLGAGYYMALRRNKVLDDYPDFHNFWIKNNKEGQFKSYISQNTDVVWNITQLKRYERKKINPLPSKIDTHLLQTGKPYISPSNPGEKMFMKKLFLKDYFVPVNSAIEVSMPMIVINGAILNNGERLPMMPHIMSHFIIKKSIIPEDSISFKSYNYGYGFPLNYAITCSNSFPGIVPITKFEIKDTSEVLRIIDGGVVDNFGIRTLLELLELDKAEINRKKALIVDCKADYDGAQLQSKDRVKLIPLLKEALFYTLSTRYLTFEDELNHLTEQHGINREKGVLRIGFQSIKTEYKKLYQISDDSTKLIINSLKEDFKKARIKKNDKPKKPKKISNKLIMYQKLVNDLNESGTFGNVTTKNVSEIPTEKFSHFTLPQVFLIFELSAQVKTKLGNHNWEKQVLILAGRYTVYLEEENIKKLITSR